MEERQTDHVEEKLRAAYRDLLKKCLLRELFEKNYRQIPRNTKTPLYRARTLAVDLSRLVLNPVGLEVVSTRGPFGETMTSMDSLDHMQMRIEEVLREDVPGDLVETGVWRGGLTIFMKAVLNSYGDKTRNVWVCDSFEGLPKPDPSTYAADKGDQLWSQSLDVGLQVVKGNFTRYGVLTNRVQFLKGFFEDTIPHAPIEKISILRLDGDMYGSTMVVLRNLYPKLSPGGYVIVDDYAIIPACRQAVHDFRREMNIQEPLSFYPYEPWEAHWRKAK